MISKTIVFRGTLFSDTPIYLQSVQTFLLRSAQRVGADQAQPRQRCGFCIAAPQGWYWAVRFHGIKAFSTASPKCLELWTLMAWGDWGDVDFSGTGKANKSGDLEHAWK